MRPLGAAITVAAAVALLACGGAGSSPSTSPAQGGSASQSTSAAASDTGPASGSPSTTRAAAGPAVHGGGVTLALPTGWRDGSSLAGAASSAASSLGLGQASGSQLLIALGPVVDGFRRNLNVGLVQQYVPDVTRLEGANFDAMRAQLENSALKATLVTDPRRVVVALQPAEEWTAIAAPAGQVYAVTQILVSHAGRSYIATFSNARGDTAAAEDLAALLAGWSWS